MSGNAVMHDAVAGKILALGGATSYQLVAATANAHILTVGKPNTTVSVTSIGNMHYRRAFANGVVLPDGSVFIVGGQECISPFSF
jgi:galactose oxidase